MQAYRGNARKVYCEFRSQLDAAVSTDCVIRALERLQPVVNSRSIAIIEPGGVAFGGKLLLRANLGSLGFWNDYLSLMQTNHEPLSRLQRLNPQPIALSDIERHLRLRQRSRPLARLLAGYAMNEAFVVPSNDRQLQPSLTVFAGANLELRPTYRHLMTQTATDAVAQLRKCSEEGAQPKLTNRQMQIATWLVAGKTDWEIGEILRISPKTVNFHVENIKRQYGVKSRGQFIAAIVHQGGVQPA